MIYNVSMKLENLFENDQAVKILNQFLPGAEQMAKHNPQAVKLSVEQLVRYTRVPQGEELLKKLDEALNALNTPENAISPSERKQIDFFLSVAKEDEAKARKEETHHQEAIFPGKPWLDTKGERIQAHGGAVYEEDGVYYWYGENKAHTDGKNGIWTWGIKVYASTDLMNWEDRGFLVPPVLDDPNAALFPTKRVDRPHILRCPSTGKYVLWIKLSGPEAAFTIWQADRLLGPYEMVVNLYNPGGHKAGDFDLVCDEESGEGYLYFDADHRSMLCMRLSEDYLSAAEEVCANYAGLRPPFTREAPALFEAEGKKYMLTSGMTGYVPNKSDSAISERWDSLFESLGDPHVNDASHASFNSQISKTFRVKGTDQWIAMADRWLPDTPVDARLADVFTRVIAGTYDPEHYEATDDERREMYAANKLEEAHTCSSDYVWLPIEMKDGRPTISWKEAWRPAHKKTFLKGSTDRTPSDLELSNRALARRAASEGMVLLKNDGTLPLKDKRIALYGSGARMTVKGGTGSGAVRERYSVSIEQGLLDAGYEILSTPWLDRFDRFYEETYSAYREEMEEKVKGIQNFYQILGMIPPFRYPTGIPIEPEDIADCDTAVFVLARQAGEGNDREDVKGDYRLDDVEIRNLETLSKAYRNLVVVLNVGGVIDVSFLDRLHVSALVYFVQGGEEGGNALADLLSGKTNFSGRLTTGWAYEFSDLPSNTTYSYLGGDRFNQEYNEGIYVGYRFFDTFGVKPRFPFGFGLSYTGFELSLRDVRTEQEEILLAATVKNTGNVSGREVVQLYATVPFGKTGAEAKRLVAFMKTREIRPGETAEILMKVPVKALACYEEERSSWVLREGDYVLRLGRSSDETKACALLRLEKEAVLERCMPVCPPEHRVEEIVPPERKAEDYEGLPVILLSPDAFECVTHTYEKPEEEIDPLVLKMSDRQLATMVCGGGTSPKLVQVSAMGASGCTTPQLFESCGIPNTILSDGPQGLNLTPQVVEMPDGSLRAARVPETLKAYERYLFGFSRMALLSQMAAPEDGTVHYQYATAWPCSQLLAQSFDPGLMEEVGDATGAEMEAFGVTVWLAPGMNIHRNPLCGRTFEYYSEDPLVSGKMAAAIVRGVQKHPGKGMSVKHFAANNCELERNASSSNMTERTLREIYLRGFEIAVKESEPMTVMASYNKVNGVYSTNNYDLLVRVLRNEWGFQGLVMSDWDSMKADRTDCMKAATGDVLKAQAAQCDLVMPGRPDQVEALTRALSEGLVKREDLLRSATRILKMIRKNTALPI